ncbi:hypothetical protein WMO41_11910 [Ventrimonas sp. CLA-AP-H27]|uniref:O-antigen ligase like membrane protein n=1 Tax=Ventrimonas faecis TaxID=3133170 RepID=A0ABV1HNG2_9FIRM
MIINIYSIISVLIYITTFFSTTYFNYNILRYVLIAIIAILLAAKMPVGTILRNLKLNILVMLFLCATLWSSFSSNYGVDRNLKLASIVFCVAFLEFVLFLEIITDKNLMLLCLKSWYKCAVIISMITDILVMTQGSVNGNYLVGTKFAVVYQHLFLLALFMIVNAGALQKSNSLKNYRVRLSFCILLIFTGFLSIHIDCMTGVIGVVLFFLFGLLVKQKTVVMTHGFVFLGVVLVSFAFMWGVPFIMGNKNIASFITNNLNRSLTLTGRTVIFEQIPRIMDGKWVLGFGYGSSYEICFKYIGFADTQNALMEWIMQVGILGTGLFCSIIYYCISKVHKTFTSYTEWVWFLAFAYTYVVLGMIEITYGMQFMGALLVLYFMSTTVDK